MDPGPEPKRPRMAASWSNSTLPHPHSQHTQHPLHSHPHPHQQLHHPHPPPPPPTLPPPNHAPAPHTPHSHPPPPPPTSATSPHPLHRSTPNPYQNYNPRPVEHVTTPTTPVVGPPGPPHHALPDPERRHHEPEHYAPMQDPYRSHHAHHPPPPPPPPSQLQSHQQQSPSQSHAPYQYPGPRDSNVKREPSEDHRRPNSTGHAPEPLPSQQHHQQAPPPHQQPPPPPPPHPIQTSHNPLPPHPGAQHPPYQDNQPRHMGYESGHQAPPTPGPYRAPSFPPPTPVAHHTPYDHGGFQPPSEPFYSVYSSAASAAKQKKNTRASQACDQCRQLKAKCDETKPCKTCRDKGTECKYRDPVPKATDKAQADILDGIAALQSSFNTMMEHMSTMDQRLRHMESREIQLPPMKPDPVVDDIKSTRSTSHSVNNITANGSFHHEETNGSQPPPQEQLAIHEEEAEEYPGPVVPPGEHAIPVNHTTLAGLLLDWPGIRDLARPHLEKQGVDFISEFPISQEQGRGLMIVYGRGEDSYKARKAVQQPDHGSLSMPDDASDAASPAPAADWGHTGGGLSPQDFLEYKSGILDSDGNPDFSESKVWTYVQSFKDNMLNMHPIIEPKILDGWVRHFLDTLPVAQSKPAKPGIVFATSAAIENTGFKRKRSPGPEGTEGSSASSAPRTGKPDRSLVSAIVLTVLALGKICLISQRAIPDVLHPIDSSFSIRASPHMRNGVLSSPGQGSPPPLSSNSHSSGLPSPKEYHERSMHSRRSSIQGQAVLRPRANLKKNYEVIPGLEYFAYATDILGNTMGSYNTMKDVYACIFGSLYQGQLGRPMESFAFIHRASHKLMVILRPTLNRLKQLKQGFLPITEPRHNQLALAFWTCLQLESDLIAELHLPPSGLLQYEDDMPHPSMSLLEGFDQRVLDSYPGQLYLRKHLNSIHRMFYSPEDPSQPNQGSRFQNVDLVADAVSDMKWVAPSFAFSESDPPATDILSARLRAKYWGAQVITYRPFIRQILTFSEQLEKNPSSPELPVRSEFKKGINAPVIHPGTRNHGDIDRRIIELARRGINALIESTRAFHGMGQNQRPIITNVFGTAHAQWGNILVLSAAWKDPILGRFVDDSLLRGLMGRTIEFLEQSSTATSSLRIDRNILVGLKNDFFGPDTEAPPRLSSRAESPAIGSPKTEPDVDMAMDRTP